MIKKKALSGIHVRKVVQRLFNGLPVVDATRKLLIHAIDADIKSAKRKDPSHCILTNACRRVRLALRRLFSYLCIRRNRPRQEDREDRAIRSSNKNQGFGDAVRQGRRDGRRRICPESTVGRSTLDYKLEHSRALARKPRLADKRPRSEPAPTIGDYRNGTGLVQFFKAQKLWERT